jgi:hypothetical protein
MRASLIFSLLASSLAHAASWSFEDGQLAEIKGSEIASKKPQVLPIDQSAGLIPLDSPRTKP